MTYLHFCVNWVYALFVFFAVHSASFEDVSDDRKRAALFITRMESDVRIKSQIVMLTQLCKRADTSLWLYGDDICIMHTHFYIATNGNEQ